MNIPVENKKYLYRQKALKHYYDNIDYYRNYYALNKVRLIEYSKNYKKNIMKKQTFNDLMTSKEKKGLRILQGNFTVHFD
jgi:hypothetical protein